MKDQTGMDVGFSNQERYYPSSFGYNLVSVWCPWKIGRKHDFKVCVLHQDFYFTPQEFLMYYFMA